MTLTPFLAHERALILRGDCMSLAGLLAPNSIDALVTDPPAGIGFMGKGWDSDKGGRDAWIAWLAERMRLALRLLKPGAYALIWALPRTSHWTATALEDAGFEIRDVVMHLFGTGFPKSMSIDKAIDAHVGAERAVVGRGVAACKYLDAGVPCEGHDNGTLQPTVHAPQTAPGSPEAARWVGWGTALKPAAEHWILARKPLEGTYAENILTHGTGGLNVDGCRIGHTKDVPVSAASDRIGQLSKGDEKGRTTNTPGFDPNVGRWPAHVTLDEEAAAMLDERSGTLAKRGNRGSSSTKAPSVAMGAPTEHACGAEYNYGDSGGASRFFYVAKAPRSEKEAGLAHLRTRSGGEATDREEGSAGLKNPRAGAGRTGGARNFHPTVKSTALMRWLCRLITPPGGIVLDMFTGSGSTAVAALAEGFSFIGSELDVDEKTGRPLGYMDINVNRARHALGLPPTPSAYADAGVAGPDADAEQTAAVERSDGERMNA